MPRKLLKRRWIARLGRCDYNVLQPMFSDRTGWNRQENELTRAAEALRSIGAPLLDLTRSNPTECGFSYDEKAVHGALAQTGVLRYEPHARGLAVAREAILHYYKNCHGAAVPSDDLVLTSGTSEGYC